MKNTNISRRKFLNTAAAAASFAMVPLNNSCAGGPKAVTEILAGQNGQATKRSPGLL